MHLLIMIAVIVAMVALVVTLPTMVYLWVRFIRDMRAARKCDQIMSGLDSSYAKGFWDNAGKDDDSS